MELDGYFLVHKQCISEQKSQIWDWRAGNREKKEEPHNTLTSLYTVLYTVYGSLFIRSFPFAKGEIMAFPRKRNLGFAKSLPLYTPLPVPTAIGSPFHFFHPFHHLGLAYCNVCP